MENNNGLNKEENKVENKEENIFENQNDNKENNKIENTIENKEEKIEENKVTNKEDNKVDNIIENKEENKIENKEENKIENKDENKIENKDENKIENKDENKIENKEENKIENKEENKIENKDDLPDDQDIIDAIKTIENKKLYPSLLQLNKYNNDLIEEEHKSYRKDFISLRNKYELKYFNIYSQIKDIIFSETEIPEISKEDYETYNINEEDSKKNKEIPFFWRTVIQNCKCYICNEKDELILNNLIDIIIIPLENKIDFQVNYIFKPNDYMENTILTKKYFYNILNEKLINVEGCEINWKSEDKNPTIKKTVKFIKKKKSKEKQIITKEIESFFDIFSKKIKDNLSNEEQQAKFLKEDFLPNSLEYYLNIFIVDDHSNCDCDKHEHNKKKK